MAITLDGNNTGTVGVINSATAVASTSGTSIDFTGIPSGVKRITVMFNAISTSGSSILQVQIGSGSVTTSGYSSLSSEIYSGVATTTATSGFIFYTNVAAAVCSGHMVLTNVSGNIWVSSHTIMNYTATAYAMVGSGTVTLGGVLDRVRVTTVNGTDTFDAGSINILYE